MPKVAKLVAVSLLTRVVVDDTATDEEILDAARPHYFDKVRTELDDNRIYRRRYRMSLRS